MTTNKPQKYEHRSLRPPRQGFMPEGVYWSQWVDAMSKEPKWDDVAGEWQKQPIEEVLRDYPWQLSNRLTQVVASVVTWLGTNCGQSFLTDVTRLKETLVPSREEQAYQMQWAIENARTIGFNNNVRVIEYCCAADSKHPLSSDDYEVVEHLMRWLGTRNGQKFIAKCQRKIKFLQEEERYDNEP